MAEDIRRDFEAVASRWDSNPGRVKIAHDVASTIMREVKLSPQMDVLDYGCGTGLLAMHLQPFVNSVTGADNSPAMLEVLTEKISIAGNQPMRIPSSWISSAARMPPDNTISS